MKPALRATALPIWLMCGGLASAAEPTTETTLPAVTVQPADVRDRDVPSTTRIEAEAFADSPAASAADLSAHAVSLQLTRPDNRNTGLFVRGLGTTSYNDGLSGSVGVTVDGVVLGRQGMFPKRLFDIESVDVQRTPSLAGPGPATSAGAVHLRTQAPQWHDEAELRMQRGSHGFESYETVVGGALIDGTLAGRFSGYTQRRSGLVHNQVSGQDINNESHNGLRGQLLWEPDAPMRARLTVERNRLDENCCAYIATQYGAATRARAAALGHTLPPADPRQRTVAQDGSNRSQMDQDAATLQLEFDLPGGQRLVGITGWRDWRYNTRYDLDSIDLAIAPIGTWEMDHQQWSQELRLEGELAPAVDYRIGAYYLRQSHTRNGQLTYGPDAARWFTVGAPLPPIPPDVLADLLDGATVNARAKQTAVTRSVFGQLDWAPRDDLDVTGILRYSRDHKNASRARQISGLRPVPPVPALLTLAQQLRGMLLGAETAGRFGVQDNSLDGALRANYRPRAGVQLDFGASTGYKPGGINSEPVTGPVSSTFAPERSLSLEASLTLALERQGHLRVTLFQTDIRDYQTLSYNPESSPLIPLMNNLINVEHVRSRGVEVESAFDLSKSLRLAIGAAYNDARYVDFDDAPCPPGTGTLYCDFSGKQMAQAPRWTAFANLRHEHPLGNGQTFHAGVNYHWRSGYYGATERGNGSYVNARGLVDAHVGLRDRHWDLTLWVRNLTDQRHTTATYALNGGGD